MPTLRPHGLPDFLVLPSLSPRFYANSYTLSQWCYPTISSSVTLFSFCPQSFPASVSSSKSALCIRWPKYWTFSISLSDEYSGLTSFRIDWQERIGGNTQIKIGVLFMKKFTTNSLGSKETTRDSASPVLAACTELLISLGLKGQGEEEVTGIQLEILFGRVGHLERSSEL